MVTNPKQSIKPEIGSVGVLSKSKTSVEVVKEVNIAGKPGSAIGSVSTYSFDPDNFNDDIGVRHEKAKISQWGNDNQFPNSLKSLYGNNIAPGLMDFKVDMLFGEGPELMKIEQGKRIYTNDRQVSDWLKSWNYIDFLISAFADAVMHENIFCQYITSKGVATGLGAKLKIAELFFVDSDECRISVKNKGISEYIFVNDWEKQSSNKADVYKAYNSRNPEESISKQKIVMRHVKKKSSLFKYYALPVYVGVLPMWLPLANEIPKFHLARLQRSLNIKYHIKVPLKSLEAVQQQYKFTKEKLEEWFQSKMNEIDEMLSGSSNAGKTFYSFVERDSNGKEMSGWEIKLIDNNEKEMSEANLQLYNDTNQAITSAFQVQPSLASIQLGNKMSSGSEVLNAFNLHVKTRTPIMRHLVLSLINDAIALNWPNKNIQLGIVDPILMKQEDVRTGVVDPKQPKETE